MARQAAPGRQHRLPDEACEGTCDLARALDDARDEATRSKHLLTSLLLKHDLCFDEKTPTGARRKNWTAAVWAWVRSVELPDDASRKALLYYIDRVKAAIAEKARLESLLKDETSKPRWKPRVDALRCLKGIGVVMAFNLAGAGGRQCGEETRAQRPAEADSEEARSRRGV